MIYLGEVPFTKKAIAKIETSILNYRRFARLNFKFSQMGQYTVGIHVTQTGAPIGKILTGDDIYRRTVGIFEGLLPAGFDVYVTVTPFTSDN